MARPVSQQLTDRESQIMEILWDLGPSPSESVRYALPDQPHNSTVRTLLRILQDKGYVRISGRPAIYEAAIPRSLAQTKAAKSLLARLFGGSVEKLVLRLVEDEELTPEQFERLRKQIAQRKRKGELS